MTTSFWRQVLRALARDSGPKVWPQYRVVRRITPPTEAMGSEQRARNILRISGDGAKLQRRYVTEWEDVED